ncbi:DUF2892 domain-containing protein [Methylosinus sp. PW1]|uniref:YgaP family membrane protein n=1 Tax=Methylosinus sp. PW1 TaxID=107636 RepID=UPI000AC5B961
MKNVPGWERVARVALGLALVAASVSYLGATPAGWGVGAVGLMAMTSGLLGFCPACAMVGRRLGH